MQRPLTLLLCLLAGCANPSTPNDVDAVIPASAFTIKAGKPVETMEGETHFKNLRQLTFGGQNAEAYWSNDGTKLIMQSKVPPYTADQIFTIDLATGKTKLVSTGTGATTCAYYLQGDKRIVYASTHAKSPDVPPVMRIKGKYTWTLHEGYDIFTANPDGTDLKQITNTPGYDAEATVCPTTGTLVFTSVRDGDLELYSMDPDGSNVKRLTNRVGYDGGAFFSHDGSKLVQRSGYFANDEEKQTYLDLLNRGLVQPSKMEITVLNRDGSNLHQITNNGKANFAPYWHLDNKRILFSSNMDAPRGRVFNIYMVNDDGTGLEQITHNDSFDGFPMFSPNGKYIAFASNRYGTERGETNVFVAEWVE